MDYYYLFSFVSLFTLFFYDVQGKIPESSKEKPERSLYIIASQAFVTPPLFFFFCTISFFFCPKPPYKSLLPL